MILKNQELYLVPHLKAEWKSRTGEDLRVQAGREGIGIGKGNRLGRKRAESEGRGRKEVVSPCISASLLSHGYLPTDVY
jgi:hypothetical protein